MCVFKAKTLPPFSTCGFACAEENSKVHVDPYLKPHPE